MSRPDWCPEDAWDYAEAVESVWRNLPPQEAVEHHARALLSAKREQQAEIDRLNKVIDRMQATMSSQAEQWTRSMAAAKRESMMEAAAILSTIYPDEEAAEGVASWGDYVQIAQTTIRAKAQEIGK